MLLDNSKANVLTGEGRRIVLLRKDVCLENVGNISYCI